jgi:Arc/MetJ family transcription regulator
MGTKLSKARRTTLLLDPDLMREAQEILHTESQSDTVRTALSEVVALRRRLALLDLELPDLTSEAVAEVRRDRVFEDV